MTPPPAIVACKAAGSGTKGSAREEWLRGPLEEAQGSNKIAFKERNCRPQSCRSLAGSSLAERADLDQAVKLLVSTDGKL